MTNDCIGERNSAKQHLRAVVDLSKHDGFEWDPGEFSFTDPSKNRGSGYIYKTGGFTMRLRFSFVWRVTCLELGEIGEMTHRPIEQIRKALDGWAARLKNER